MSHATSTQSTTGTIASYAKKIAHAGRPDMDIELDDYNEGNGKVYTTFDAVTGRVNITTPHEAPFDQIQISLVGSVFTFVGNLSPQSTRSRVCAKHNFLRLNMPIPESSYPQPRVAEAGKTYTFAFNFVIPSELLPRACSHACSNDHVQAAHLQPPPSIGDLLPSLKDDLTPEMVRVEYAIEVKVIQNRERDGKEMVLANCSKKIRVRPATPEAPPMNIAAGDEEYVLSKVKGLKKGMFSGKLGRITVSAAQPSALVIPSPSVSSEMTTQPTTTARVMLRFDPHDSSSPPPRLGGLTTKIKATTFYATRAATDFPARSAGQLEFETNRGIYETSVPLSARCVESVTWTAHKPSPAYTRRGSASSTSSSDDYYSDSALSPADCHSTGAEESKEFYTASILVPITLPQSKSWIPTFHSCITSRVYCIALTLTIHTPGAGVSSSSVRLQLPVQIAADGNNGRRASMTAEEAAAAELEAQEEILERRVRQESIVRSALGSEDCEDGDVGEAPPGYDDFAPRRAISVGRS
ncbi:hypothetical protein BUE80_DR012783 [Diplocarpon rosae]|nr:hypothetical protein BUE80_DR012783 [Diplocarpon rosae]